MDKQILFKKKIDFKTWHGSRLVSGFLQIFAAVIVSVLFPYHLESTRAEKQELLDLIRKQEEIFAGFTKSISLSVSLNDDIRACLYRANCLQEDKLANSCDKILTDGKMLLVSSGEMYESICSIAQVYFSEGLSQKIDNIKKDIDELFACSVSPCGGGDAKYKEIFQRIMQVTYPEIVAGMRDEIISMRKKLR